MTSTAAATAAAPAMMTTAAATAATVTAATMAMTTTAATTTIITMTKHVLHVTSVWEPTAVNINRRRVKQIKMTALMFVTNRISS